MLVQREKSEQFVIAFIQGLGPILPEAKHITYTQGHIMFDLYGYSFDVGEKYVKATKGEFQKTTEHDYSNIWNIVRQYKK